MVEHSLMISLIHLFRLLSLFLLFCLDLMLSVDALSQLSCFEGLRLNNLGYLMVFSILPPLPSSSLCLGKASFSAHRSLLSPFLSGSIGSFFISKLHCIEYSPLFHISCFRLCPLWSFFAHLSVHVFEPSEPLFLPSIFKILLYAFERLVFRSTF